MRIPRLAALWAVVAIVLAACTGGGASPSASAGGSTGSVACKVGVSWNNFQQPRWAAADKPNLQETVEAGGGEYTDVDANLDSVQQLTDVENLINQGINVLVLLAQDTTVVGPALEAAAAANIPVIAYDRLIEDPSVLYITFDNVGVGGAEAEAMLEKVPTGTYVLIKGDPGDPNASTFLPQGWNEAGLQDAIDAGDITVFDEQFTDAWDTQTAQNNMEAIIDAANSEDVQIDAVLAENDSTALGVAAALQAKSYDQIPVSGQDGDPANLNNVALGWQYIDVWKNANELGKAAGSAALQLCAGTEMAGDHAAGRPHRSDGGAGQPDGVRLRDPGTGRNAGLGRREHRQVVHPEADTSHRRDAEPADRRRLVGDQGRHLRGSDRGRSGSGRLRRVTS